MRRPVHRRVTGFLFRLAGSGFHRWWIELFLTCRALLFVGTRYTCPCCGWRLRAFTKGGVSLTTRYHGYCPRCNAKARHRRDWLFLSDNTTLFRNRTKLLHVSPKYALSRRFTRLPNVDVVAIDIAQRPNVNEIADVAALPFEDGTFDAAICIHVLEHVEDDRRAIHELYRVLRPGGWAFISVPIELDRATFEDPSIVSPEDRKRAFGEEQHVRVYGIDFIDRLRDGGFSVRMDRGQDIDEAAMEKFGLLADENVFLCTKH